MPAKTEMHMTAVADLIAGQLGRETATKTQPPAHALNHQPSQNQAIGGLHGRGMGQDNSNWEAPYSG